MEKLTVEKYGRGWVIWGDSKPYKSELQELGFKGNPNLMRDGEKTYGYVVTNKDEQVARDFVRKVNSGKVKPSAAPSRGESSVSRERTTKPISRATTTKSVDNTSGIAKYRFLSGLNDLYAANYLSSKNEDVSDSPSANKYNMFISMTQTDKFDTALLRVLHSSIYSEVCDLTEISVGVELGQYNVNVLPSSTLFDGQICLTALRMALVGDKDTAYGIQVVGYHNRGIADTIETHIKKSEIKRKVQGSPRRSLKSPVQYSDDEADVSPRKERRLSPLPSSQGRRSRQPAVYEEEVQELEELEEAPVEKIPRRIPKKLDVEGKEIKPPQDWADDL